MGTLRLSELITCILPSKLLTVVLEKVTSLRINSLFYVVKCTFLDVKCTFLVVKYTFHVVK